MNKTVFIGLFALVFLGGGCLSTDSEGEASTEFDRDSVLVEARENGLIMNSEETALMTQTSLTTDSNPLPSRDAESYVNTDTRDWFSAALADVTGGTSFGIAHSQYDSGTFTLVVEMGNLPEPASGYFYEGWLVRRGESLSILSTGRAEVTQDGFANVYLSRTDLTDYDFYVLTLEAEDGNPAPSEHILEGTLK